MKNCSNEECRLGPEGTCYEGISPAEDCLNAGRYNDLEVTDINSLLPVNKDEELDSPRIHVDTDLESEYVEIHDGELLTDELASRVLQKSGGRVVACIGPSNVGKTTLLASIFELFGLGAVGDFRFSGSQTLFHFERICHQSRLKSKRNSSDMLHTKRTNSARFHHLSLMKESRRIELLLSDRAGEDYHDAIDSSTHCKTLYEIKRADSVLLLVDALSLGCNQQRHAAKARVKSLIDRLLINEMIGSKTQLILVMTRFDLVKGSANESVAEKEFDRLKSAVDKKVKGTIYKFNAIKTAARPTSDVGLDAGYGIEEILALITIDKFTQQLNDFTTKSEVAVKRHFHRIRA